MPASAAPLPILVRKYGGSSLASVDRIGAVARDLAAKRAGGCRLVVVVSAMGRHTDELEHLARQVSPQPPRRELDMLLSVGERVSMSLLSMALEVCGVPAISLTGSQCGVITDESHTEARILEVRADRVREALDRGLVVVVAGFQGVSRQKEITTLGRGGSDATAVALAAALGAERCEILKDVDGVFTADPHLVEGARRHDALAYDEMSAVAEAGCEVVHPRAVAYAREHGVPLFVGSSFHDSPGTLIGPAASAGGRDAPADPPSRLRPLSLVATDDVALLELATDDAARFARWRDAAAAACRGDLFLGEWLEQGPGRCRWRVLHRAEPLAHLRDSLAPDVGGPGDAVRFRRGLTCLALAGRPPANWVTVAGQVGELLAAHGVGEPEILADGAVLRLLLRPEDASRLLQPLHDAYLAGETR